MKKFSRLIANILPIVILMFGSTLSNAADITSTAQGGLWDDKTTWIGGVLPKATDNVIITSVVTTGDTYYSSTTFKMVNLTINSGGKLLREKERAGRYVLEISGNLINNGEIIDYKDYFDIYLYGNLVNNGVFKPRLVYLEGKNQQISTTKPIECKTLNLSMDDNDAIASSNLQFKNCYIPANGTKTLNMGLFNLNLSADSVTYDSYYGEVYSKCELLAPVKFDKTGIINLDKSVLGKTVTGNFILQSTSYAIIKDLTVEGNMTIDENTKVTSKENLVKLIVKGNFTNYGELNKDSVKIGKFKFPRRSMNLYAYGNILNIGVTGISTKVYPISNGNTISLKGNFEGNVEVRQAENSATPGSKVVIDGEVSITGDLLVNSNLEISKSGALNMLTKTTYNPIYVGTGLGSVKNNGKIYQYHRVSNSWGNRLFNNKAGMNIDIELRDWAGIVDGNDITVFNGSTYPELPGSTLRWWRVVPKGPGKVTGYTLKLYYDESQLNGQKEKNLKAFRSGDQGKTWELLSVGSNAKLDTIENSITIGTWNNSASLLKEFGDFVISSGDGSVPLPSPIVVKLVGRDQVRIGAPNRYSVYMQNIDPNQSSSNFFVSVNLDGDARFLKVEIPNKDGKMVLPIDSIGNKDDNTLAFYIPGLDANEERSFDVIITALPDQTKSATIAPVVIWVAGVAVIGAISVVGDFVADVVHDQIDMSQKEKEDLADVTGITLKTMNDHRKKEDIGTYAMKTTLKATMEKLSKVHPVTYTAFKTGEKLELVAKFSPSLRYRFIAWAKSKFNQDGKNELRMLEDNTLVLEKTASDDPNEKAGPSGFGTENHISSAGKMHYTIFFENKKEATAPAYRIQIMDTLSAVFDFNTVKFGSTSHPAPKYNWKMTREGNILKWDIEEIELVPNVNPPEGEGYVTFSVDLIEGLKSGDKIDNKATIIFDLNKPITTNTWRNVLDKIAPVTKMIPIKYSIGDSLVNVSCNATDNENGAGPRKYSFFVSVNNEPFKLYGETSLNTIQYPVSKKSKNTYRFYALTTDNVNNSETQVPQIVELKSIPVANEKIEGINENIDIYPNPTSGIIILDLFVADRSELSVNIYSVTGELVKSQQTLWLEPGKQLIDSDISKLERGIYFIQVKINNKVESFKVIKN